MAESVSRSNVSVSGATRVGPGAGGRQDSQHMLARVIAAEALEGLPSDPSAAGFERDVDRSIRAESKRMERLLAEVRLGLLAAGLLLALAGPRDPALLAILAGWGVLAGVLLAGLARGWYRRWLRVVVPATDAVGGSVLFLVVLPLVGGGRTALIASAGAAAVLLSFLGPSRLSRASTRTSAVGALLAWGVVGLSAESSLLAWSAVAALIVLSALVGWRLMAALRLLVQERARGNRLLDMYEVSQEALLAREQVLGIVCHDLRNPLSTIVATAELLLEVPMDEDARGKHLRTIGRVGGHMNRLIHDLLDVSRIEAGTLRVTPRALLLSEIFDEAREVLAGAASDESVTLDIRPPASDLRVLADPARIGQVVSNLVGNAIKFSPEGGRVVVRAERVGPAVRVSVSDRGPGIPAEALDELWKRLWQAEPGDRRGLGLGLSIARSIVEAHGQIIGVESTVGEGSEFWFTLAPAPTDEPSA